MSTECTVLIQPTIQNLIQISIYLSYKFVNILVFNKNISLKTTLSVAKTKKDSISLDDNVVLLVF